MSWSKLCFVWLVLWFAPANAGAWYDERFGVYQGIISLAILLCVYRLPNRHEWQYKSLMIVLCLQIMLDALWQAGWDYPGLMEGFVLYVSSDFYEVAALKVLNGLEAFLLFFIGGIRMAIHEYTTRAGSRDSQPDFHG